MKKALAVLIPLVCVIAAMPVRTVNEAVKNIKYKSVSIDLYSFQTLQEGGTLFSVKNLFDDDPTTCWATPFDEFKDHEKNVCDENRMPIRIILNTPLYLKKVIIRNGSQQSKTFYSNNHRAQTVLLHVFRMGGYGYDEPLQFDLKDDFNPQILNVENKFLFSDLFPTHEVWISFESVFSSDRYQDLCISEVGLEYSETIPYKPLRTWTSLKKVIDKNKYEDGKGFWLWDGVFDDKCSILRDMIYYSLCKNKDAIRYIKTLKTNHVGHSELLDFEVLRRLKACLKNDFY